MSRFMKISDEDKRQPYEAHQRGGDYVELAWQLRIKRTVALAMIKRAEDNGGEVSRPRDGIRAQPEYSE